MLDRSVLSLGWDGGYSQQRSAGFSDSRQRRQKGVKWRAKSCAPQTPGRGISFWSDGTLAGTFFLSFFEVVLKRGGGRRGEGWKVEVSLVAHQLWEAAFCLDASLDQAFPEQLPWLAKCEVKGLAAAEKSKEKQ